MMIVAHKHHGIIIYGMITRTTHPIKKSRVLRCDSVALGGENLLALSSDGIAVSIGVLCSTTHVGYIISGHHFLIVHFVGVLVGQIGAFGPVGLYGDGTHPFRYIPVGTLVEDTAADAVEVFVSTVAVGEVIS
jgi:hypothetical protein